MSHSDMDFEKAFDCPFGKVLLLTHDFKIEKANKAYAEVLGLELKG